MQKLPKIVILVGELSSLSLFSLYEFGDFTVNSQFSQQSRVLVEDLSSSFQLLPFLRFFIKFAIFAKISSPGWRLVFLFSAFKVFCAFSQNSQFSQKPRVLVGDSSSFQLLRFWRKFSIFAAACKPGHKCAFVASCTRCYVYSNSNKYSNNLYCQKIKVHVFCYIIIAYTVNKNLP